MKQLRVLRLKPPWKSPWIELEALGREERESIDSL